MSRRIDPRELERLRVELADRYTIERELGAGGMAVVYLARDLRNDRDVALKVLRSEPGTMMGAERFQREIRLAAQLSHPRILPLLDSGAAAGHLWYTMPYIAGESLGARLARENRLGVEEALGIAAEVADALSYAHGHGILHRDIKPDNILLSEGHALVADFGIARAIIGRPGEPRITGTGISVGTPAYMSPEQATGEEGLDGRSDLYALACVTYEMLSGEPPYTGPTAQVIIARRLSQPVPPLRGARDAVPEHVELALRRALAPAPADRFADTGAFAAALAGRSTEAAPGTGRRRRWRTAAILGLALLLAAAWLYWRWTCCGR